MARGKTLNDASTEVDEGMGDGEGLFSGLAPEGDYTSSRIQPGDAPSGYGGELGGQVEIPEGFDPQTAQSSSGPREEGAFRATRRRPSEPTPQAGSSFMAGGGGGGSLGAVLGGVGGMMPFNPMEGSMSPAEMASGASRRSPGSLFGAQGGLQGGGLGMPLDPTSNSESDPISSLIEALLKGGSV